MKLMTAHFFNAEHPLQIWSFFGLEKYQLRAPHRDHYSGGFHAGHYLTMT